MKKKTEKLRLLFPWYANREPIILQVFVIAVYSIDFFFQSTFSHELWRDVCGGDRKWAMKGSEDGLFRLKARGSCGSWGQEPADRNFQDQISPSEAAYTRIQT